MLSRFGGKAANRRKGLTVAKLLLDLVMKFNPEFFCVDG